MGRCWNFEPAPDDDVDQGLKGGNLVAPSSRCPVGKSGTAVEHAFTLAFYLKGKECGRDMVSANWVSLGEAVSELAVPGIQVLILLGTSHNIVDSRMVF